MSRRAVTLSVVGVVLGVVSAVITWFLLSLNDADLAGVWAGIIGLGFGIIGVFLAFWFGVGADRPTLPPAGRVVTQNVTVGTGNAYKVGGDATTTINHPRPPG